MYSVVCLCIHIVLN